MASDPADQLPPIPRFVSVPIHTYFSYDPEGLRDYLNKHQELEQKLRMRYLFGLLGARIAAGSKDPREPAGTKNPEEPEDSEDANESERSKDAKESTGAKHAHEIGHILFDLAPGGDSLYRCSYVTEGWGLTEVHVQHIPFDEEKEMSNLEFWEEICGFNPQLVPSPYPFSKAYGLFGRYGRYEGVIHELCSHDLSKTVAHFCCPVESLEPAYCKGESQSGEKRPLMMIWEPYFEGKFCVPKNLEKIKKACGQFDVVITNHVDLQAMFSEDPERSSSIRRRILRKLLAHSPVMEILARRFRVESYADELLRAGVGRSGTGWVVVRAGTRGCLVASAQGERVWLGPTRECFAYGGEDDGGVWRPMFAGALGYAVSRGDSLVEAAKLATVVLECRRYMPPLWVVTKEPTEPYVDKVPSPSKWLLRLEGQLEKELKDYKAISSASW